MQKNILLIVIISMGSGFVSSNNDEKFECPDIKSELCKNVILSLQSGKFSYIERSTINISDFQYFLPYYEGDSFSRRKQFKEEFHHELILSLKNSDDFDEMVEYYNQKQLICDSVTVRSTQRYYSNKHCRLEMHFSDSEDCLFKKLEIEAVHLNRGWMIIGMDRRFGDSDKSHLPTNIVSNNNDTINVNGYVYNDSSKEPLVGAGVHIIGTTHGTITDQHGYFDLSSVFQRFTLEIDYVGFFHVYLLNIDKNLTIDSIQLIRNRCASLSHSDFSCWDNIQSNKQDHTLNLNSKKVKIEPDACSRGFIYDLRSK